MNVIKDNEFVECQYCHGEVLDMTRLNICKSRSGYCDRGRLRYERCSKLLCMNCEYCSYCTERIRTLKLKMDRSRPINGEIKLWNYEYKDTKEALKGQYDITYE